MVNKWQQKWSYTCAPIVVQSCILLMWSNIIQEVFRFPFVILFTNSAPFLGPYMWTFKIKSKACQMIVLENNLYIVVCTIMFVMQYWPFYFRVPLSVNIMSNLVSIRQRGDYFQYLQQSTSLEASRHPWQGLSSQIITKLSLNKFARNGLWGSKWILLRECFYHLVHPLQSLSILSLGTRMVMQINLHNKTIILQGRKVTNNSKHTCTTPRCTKCQVFAKYACAFGQAL
jgi:hypothetical protein